MKRIITILLIIVSLLVATIAGGFFYVIHHAMVDFSALAHYNPTAATILLDDEGKEWARFSYDRREPITIDRIPKHLINAFIAAEDWHFFAHAGISWKGIARSLLVNFTRGRKVQGASTITQQLIKLLFVGSERTFTRKIKEQYYAILVEQQFTKEYILQTYLNHIYFGCGIYGVQAACERFWGKSIEQISIEQAATLASVIRSPGHYSPLLQPASCLQRRNLILGIMKKLHFISSEQWNEAVAQPLHINATEHENVGAHFKESLRVWLEDQFGKESVYGQGLLVQTTMNKAMQRQAEQALQSTIQQLRVGLHKPVDGALLSLDVTTGAIKAMVGGYDFATSKFNRALQAKRQMGSIFKPLIYAVAMEQGKTFTELAVDEPLDIMMHNALWQPHNYNNEFEGTMTLARALVRSNNIIAIKTLLSVGYEPVIDLAYRCHLSSSLSAYPSLALGCVDATVKEVAGMFTVFANGGIYHEPHMVVWVKDHLGTKIGKTHPEHKRVIDARSVGQVSKVLEFGIQRMRNSFNSQLVDSDVVCKTGTTNESRTCWFAGATPEIATVVYVGCDDNQSLGTDVYPLRTAFPIWRSLHETLCTKQKSFVYDTALKEMVINQWTGKQTSLDDRQALRVMRVR